MPPDQEQSAPRKGRQDPKALQGPGRLYVVATPIGNLEDITLRALRILKEVDGIAAENAPRTRALCEHYEIRTPITRYHQHNRHRKALQLIERIFSGNDLALVTDAGTPGISDPGVHLIELALRKGIEVTPIPGPSAVAAALSVSGLPSNEFVFLGFLPAKAGKRRKKLEALVEETRTMVLFEAPHRLMEMLSDVKDILGDRQMILLREMTKVFEDMKRGSASDIAAAVRPEEIRGECTLVVEGAQGRRPRDLPNDHILKRMDAYLKNGKMSVRDIAHALSREEDIPYRRLYKECLQRKGKIRDASEIGKNGTGEEARDQE